jgi:hypothetical protein
MIAWNKNDINVYTTYIKKLVTLTPDKKEHVKNYLIDNSFRFGKYAGKIKPENNYIAVKNRNCIRNIPQIFAELGYLGPYDRVKQNVIYIDNNPLNLELSNLEIVNLDENKVIKLEEKRLNHPLKADEKRNLLKALRKR